MVASGADTEKEHRPKFVTVETTTSSPRMDDCIPLLKQAGSNQTKLVLYSLWNWQSVKSIMQRNTDVVQLVQATDESSSTVHHCLKSVELILR